MAGTTIEFAPLLPWIAVLILGFVAALLAGLGLYVRANGALLRTLAFAVLVLTLLNPSLVAEEREPLKDVAVVIVDDSPSQGIGDRRAQTAAALQAIETEAEKFKDTLDLRVVKVGQDGLAAADQGTRLLGPLTRALSDVPARRVAGAILLTDGQVHDITADTRADGLPAPLHVLLSGQADETDRRLVIVKAPAFGIVGKEQEMTIRVEDNAPSLDKNTTLTIRRDGGDIITTTAPIGSDHQLAFTLNHGGPTVFEIEVAPGPNELTRINNRAVISINGIRDRLRVLLVSGEPHAGERTWRNLLKSDPSVDLIHFTILRPPEKQDGTPINELSLISFPTRELFEVKIADFDLVIFDRYRRRGVLPPAYLRNIVDYVADGGALLEAVGPTFAGPFSIYRTPLGKALPGEPTGEIVDRGFRPRVTEMGHRHPVTANLPGSRPDEEPGWGRWYRQIDVSVKQGRILMSGADDRPLLILDRFGEGRVAQLNSDHIWLWARGHEGGGPQAELLRRLAHWLMKEPELEENDLRAITKGERLEITRRDIDAESRSVTVTGPDGRVSEVPLEAKRDGLYTGSLPITQPGLYRVSDGDLVFMAAAGTLNPIEFSNISATADTLTPLSEATGGVARWLSDSMPKIRRVAPGRSTSGRDWIGLIANGDYIVTGVNVVPLLPALVVLLLALGATALAWRREGD
ncbi:MAG: hypothetical protein GKS00_06250 [Alphaproteobacteria bacterium]|nr:hypothetical protein [Alphaproteobacteria bacterium]